MTAEKTEIRLTDNPLENIKIMAPHLSRKQQYIVLGMILAQLDKAEISKKPDMAVEIGT